MDDHTYIKLDENFNTKGCPLNDYDGSVTGNIVINVPAWFDEHPEERKRLGWIKHIIHNAIDIDYDPQTQFLIRELKTIDRWTVEDVYHVCDKSEEMLLLEDMMEAIGYGNMLYANRYGVQRVGNFFFGGVI